MCSVQKILAAMHEILTFFSVYAELVNWSHIVWLNSVPVERGLIQAYG